MPRISVIMPVYNTEKYVWEAIDSILNQTFSDFEFIIIDDGSTDTSWKIIQKYAKEDKRIKALKNEWNKGISYTRNKLISLTTTNYVASQDSDDISTSKRLERCYNFLEKNADFVVVSWNNIVIDEEWNVIWKREYSDNIKNVILKKSPISQWSSMFRKDVFEKAWWYDRKLNYGEDYDLWLKIFSKWYKIFNLDNNLYKVRIRSWQTKSDKLKETIKNTIFIQKKAIKKYWLQPSFSDKVYHFLEHCLLLLPNRLILWLFKKLTYKNAK